jgi:hypothetical protein
MHTETSEKSIYFYVFEKVIFVSLLQVSDPVFFSYCSLLIKDVTCKLQYLDLSMAVISEEGTEKFHQFEKSSTCIKSYCITVEATCPVSVIT